MFRYFLIIILSLSVISCSKKCNNKKPMCLKAYELNKQELDKKSTKNADVSKIIASGVKNPKSSIGCYAADSESYTEFDKIFDYIVKNYHNSNGHNVKKSYDVSKIPNFSNKAKEKIISSRIRFARNSSQYPFPSSMNLEQRLDIQDKFIEFTKSNKMFANVGKYHKLVDLSEKDRLALIEENLLFKDISKDKYLQASGIAGDYPQGRGIYISNDKETIIWINEEDQFRIISLKRNSDIIGVLKNLFNMEKAMSKKFNFAYSDKYGYMNSCPTNIGTGMRASVHIKLPKLSQNMKTLKKIAKIMHLDIRGIDGEHSDSKGGVVDVSNLERLGKNEVDLIANLVNGVNILTELEEIN